MEGSELFECRWERCVLEFTGVGVERCAAFVFFVIIVYAILIVLTVFSFSVVLVIGYLVTVLLCMVLQAPLASNSNRPGPLSFPSPNLPYLFHSMSRFHGVSAISRSLPIRNQELHRLPPPRPRERLREAQLHSPLVGKGHVRRCSPPWVAVDPESSCMGFTHLGPAEGDLGRRFPWFVGRYCVEQLEAC